MLILLYNFLLEHEASKALVWKFVPRAVPPWKNKSLSKRPTFLVVFLIFKLLLWILEENMIAGSMEVVVRYVPLLANAQLDLELYD